MIEVKGLSKRFKKKQALCNITLSLGSGIYGLLGPNGAGKTTLIRTLAGVYSIQEGEILYNGTSIEKNAAYSRCIGYLPQQFGLFPGYTVTELLRYFAELKEIPRSGQRRMIEESLELVNLSDRRDDKIRTLSGGMIRRLGIAQAVLGDPQFIIVDEPTAGLDPEERARFKLLLSRLSGEKTVLLSTHIVEDVEAVCDHIILMNDGSLVGAGSSADICKIADGKVYSVPETMANQLQDPFFVLKKEGGNGRLRILSPVEQRGTQEEATIEDGYLCRIKGLG
ncbi:MAG: ABC transporter ATP-binding protein [Clostridiales bacterium]|nr:ABC transporter ATP-binding protein [Clostridiales bacterium]